MKAQMEKTLNWSKKNKLNLIPIIAKQKIPLVKHKEFQDRLSTDEERKKWFIDEDNNIAVLGGKISNNLLIFDVDDLEFASALHEKLPTTTVTKTRNGYHFFYKTDEERQSARVEFKKNDKVFGIDIHGKGKYAVIPPSIHPSGFQYEFIEYNGIKEVKVGDIMEVINEEAEKLDYQNLAKEKEKKSSSDNLKKFQKVNDDTQTLIDALDPVEQMIGFVKQGTHPIHGSTGGMNLVVDDVAGEWYCFRHNSGGSKLQWFAVQEGIINCDEASGMNTNQYHQTFEAIKVKFNIKITSKTPQIKFQNKRAEQKLNKEEILNKLKYVRWYHNGLIDKVTKETKIKPDKQRALALLATILTENFDFKCLMETDILFYYKREEGIWSEEAEIFVRQITRDVIEDITKSALEEVVDKIKTRPKVYCEDIFNKQKVLVVGNGVYDFGDFEMKPYNKEFYATRKLKWKYDTKAECPEIIAAFLSWVTEDNARKLMELTGYCLFPDYNIHSTFWLTGEGGNGKSTYCNLLIHFLNDENVTNLKPQAFNDDKSAGAMLYGKLANIGDDIPDKPLNDGGDIKNLSGQSRYSGRILYKGWFEFYNTAKMIFAAQVIPPSHDDSIAWYRRAVRIHFGNSFLGSKKDKNFLKKLITEENMSGLLNVCLDSLRTLLDRGEFELDFDVDLKKRDYIMGSDVGKAFVEYGIVQDPDSNISYEDSYNDLKDFCRFYKLNVVMKGDLTKSLNQWAANVRKGQRRIKNIETGKDNRVAWWYGFTTKKQMFGKWDVDPTVGEEEMLKLVKSKEDQNEQIEGKLSKFTNRVKSDSSDNRVSIFNTFQNKKVKKSIEKTLLPPLPTSASHDSKNEDPIFKPKEENKPKKSDLIGQVKHYLTMAANDHEDRDINVKNFKEHLIKTYHYTDKLLDEILEELSNEGEIYEPRPNIIRLNER